MLLLLLLSVKAGAEVRWTGLSANGLWADPGNWENGFLPGANDDVLLDNSFQLTDYTVRLPDFAVSVRSLQVLPGSLQSIIVELPVTNLVSSAAGSLLDRAFTTTGNGYTLLLGKGAVFINASGSSSGYALRLNDSLQVKNGAKYIHRTRTGHADIVQFLSKAAGTENGIFRFENPDAASTISLSGRVYGSLELSASASNTGIVSYSAAGTNPVVIRGDLLMEPGAGLAINFDDTIHVFGDLVINNAIFNMASGNRSSVLLLQGNWLQTGGAISETNVQQKTGTLLLNGTVGQTISCTGILTDSIVVDIMNSAGVQLLQPLRCSFGLRLSKGQLRTSNSFLLTMAPNAWLLADSIAQQEFVDGPIKKEGLNNGYFLFPVGRNGKQRWLALRNVTGDIVVEYHPETAYGISTSIGAGIDHLSRLEYWSVNNAAMGFGQVELSYDHLLSGGVSELVSLRVASFSGGTWSDAGNLATSGAAFEKGSVTSGDIQGLGTITQFVTLASSSRFTNVLPILFADQWMDYLSTGWNCNWRVGNDDGIFMYAIELSEDGIAFEKIADIPAGHEQKYFRHSLPANWNKGYCRINAIGDGGKAVKGEVMRFGLPMKSAGLISMLQPAGSGTVQIQSSQNRQVFVEIFDSGGRLFNRRNLQLHKGVTTVQLLHQSVPAGVYWLTVSENGNKLLTRGLFLQ
ncbi:T9SS type A sorting domain-containing protein [Flavihumibacter fluvii]|uniref:T9SS type A sorting domain-containing protein n=1 Tax=Flavihumibacter fluvii TaxID=2838157 RepID=UPI001EFB8CB4|nr:T9SS type A sorting domain-containing protein [Flavihumibacter fluvii]ULQ52912.1 T9SS type A sorting domain-containing protein [Flavihumibacter fluvii]